MLPPFNSETLVLGAQAARAFIQNHRIAYAHITPDLRMKLASPNLGALLTEPALLNSDRPLPELLHEFVGAEDVLHAILAGTEPFYSIEHVNRDLPDGTVMYINFRVLPLDEHNPGDGLLLIIEDVTDFDRLKQHIVQDRNELRLAKTALLRSNQELERLSRFKSFMLSMAAHDIRNALNVFMLHIGALRAAQAPDVQPKQLHSLDTINSQTTELERLINNLLSLDQAEQGKLSIRFIQCDFSRLLQGILTDLEVSARSGEIKLTCEMGEEPILIEVDPDRIKQVIHNLIGNAIKYTPRGGRVQVTLSRTGEEAVLRVSDTGSGLSAEQIEHLFQLYYRTEEAKKSSIPGSGVGLYITRTLVEAHHGTIEAASQIGQGATFIVHLPLHQPPYQIPPS